MKTSNPIRNSVPFFATACLVAGASFYASAAPCAAMPQSDGNAIQEQSQRRAKFATVRLDQGLAVGRPSGWRVKRSGSSVMLVPPPSVAVSVVVSIGPWDATRRLGDDAEQERLRQTHIAAAPGFLAAGEAVLGEGWLSLDYERESTSDSDAAMRIFVRPVGDRAVTLAIVGARSAIDRGERDWISIANTIGVQTDAAEGGASGASAAPASQPPTSQAPTSQAPAPKAAPEPVKSVSSAEAVLAAVKAVDLGGDPKANDSQKLDSVQKAIKAGSELAAALESLDRAGKVGNGAERLDTAITLASKIAGALDAFDAGGGKGVSHGERAAAAASAVRAVSDAIAVAKRDGAGNGERIDAAVSAVQAISQSLQGAGLASSDSKGMQDLQKAVSAATKIATALKGVERDASGKSDSSDLETAIRAGAEIVKALQGDGAAGNGNLNAVVGIASAVSQAVKAFDEEGKQSGGDQLSSAIGAFIEDEEASSDAGDAGGDGGQPEGPRDSTAAASKRESEPSTPAAQAAAERGTELKLGEGCALTLPRGWSAVKSEEGFELRPPSNLAESAADFEGMVGIGPWDSSDRIQDESVLSDLRAEHSEALEGFHAVGEPVVRAGWVRFDYEAETEEGDTVAARIFVRPIGSQAVAILVTGSKEFIDSLRDDWNAMADSVRKD